KPRAKISIQYAPCRWVGGLIGPLISFPMKGGRPMKKERDGSGSMEKGGRISRRKFLAMTASTTAALSFGTFLRSGLGAPNLRVLTWSNTLNAMDDVLRDQAKEYTKTKGVGVTFEF